MSGKPISRLGDMHPTRALRLRVQPGGDVVLCITQEGAPIGSFGPEEVAIIEFCVTGGRSPNTLRVLRGALAEAIELDNVQHPIRSS